MKTKAKMVKTSIIRTLEISHGLATIKMSVYSRKTLTLSKNSKLPGLIACPIYISLYLA